MDTKKKREPDEELLPDYDPQPSAESPEESAEYSGDAGYGDDEDLSPEERLEKKIDDLSVELDEMKDKYLRLSAEFDNYRKRTLKEKAELILNGSEKSITSFLPVADDLERAIETSEDSGDAVAIKEGIEHIYKKFLSILSQYGVKMIETDNRPLNTDYHEAIAVVPAMSEETRGKILDTIQTGYTMNDKVIRHAKVVVGE